MATNLLTPILNDRTRSINFFNGRLLTGEDLTAEQKANRAAHALLGQGVGSGVAYGLTVSESALLSSIPSPVVTITPGLAINPNGGILLLDAAANVSLVRPATTAAGTPSTFQECTPIQPGAYIAGAGVYLLTIGPASANQGLAEVSGVSTAAAACNSRYKADGVQFRLVQIDLSQLEISDVNRLRNLVAYKCFGIADWAADVTDPFSTPRPGHGLIDQLRAAGAISGCEVPLAALFWTATGGLVFIDLWSVRRPLLTKDLLDLFAPGAGARRASEGLAMLLQFERQVADLLQSLSPSDLLALKATDYFHYLPAAGFVPIGSIKGSAGFDYLQFFTGLTYHDPVFMEGARFDGLLRRSFLYPPKDLSNGEMVWLYRVRENMQTVLQSSAGLPQPYMMFTVGHLGYQANARFDLSYWDFANYAYV
jgi:hypothetical protein